MFGSCIVSGNTASVTVADCQPRGSRIVLSTKCLVIVTVQGILLVLL